MAADIDTQVQTFDFRSFSTSSSPLSPGIHHQTSGNKLKKRISEEYQSTVAFDDTVALESPLLEAQLENLDIDTEVQDVPECVENTRTLMADDTEEEVVLDSDDDSMHGTKAVRVTKESSFDKTRKTSLRDALESRQLAARDIVTGSFASAGKRCYIGYTRRRFSLVRAQRVRSSGLAGLHTPYSGSGGGPNSIHSDSDFQKQLVTKNYGASRVENQCSVDRNENEVVKNHESKGSSSSCEANYLVKDTSLLANDQELAERRYSVFQEPEESSQANVLDFVDRYLSVNNVNLSPEVAKKTNREKSPPVLSAKGSRSLARKAILRTTVGESGIFEWDDNHIDDVEGTFLQKKKELILDCESHWWRFATSPQTAEKVNTPKQVNLDAQFKEKIPGEIMGQNHSYSSSIVHNLNNGGIQVEQRSEMEIGKNFMELDEQLNVESSVQRLEDCGLGRHVPDMFDVGFDTQMAAEAMESLLYAPPPNYNADNTHQGPQKSGEDIPKVAMKNKASKSCFLSKRDGSDSGVVARQPKRKKRPSRKLDADVSSSIQKTPENQQERDPELLPGVNKEKRGKSLAKNYSNYRVPASAKNISCASSSKLTDRGKGGEFSERDKTLSSVEDNSCGDELSRGKNGNVLTVARRTRCRSSVKTLRKPENPTNSSGERNVGSTDICVLEKRKRSNLNADTIEMLSVKERCPSSGSDASGEFTSSKVSQQPQTDIDVTATATATATYLKLDQWSYQRGKRRCRNVPGQSNGASSKSGPFKVIAGREGIVHSFGSNILPLGNSKFNFFSVDVKRKARSSIYTRQHLSSPEKKCDESWQRFDEENKNLDALPDRNPKPSLANPKNSTKGLAVALPADKGCDIRKQEFKKTISRSPFMKELMRLGIAESLPSFASTNLRRRRTMANVRVLFSQNLDDFIIKQQKKILTRLGISIAACCSEATHFIADRFMRTKNMLEAIALGKPVVTHLWLESCNQASCYIDEKNYILRDANKEKELGFSMPVSLARTSQHPLLKGRKVIITPNVKPGKEMIASLAKTVQGQVVDKVHRAATKDEVIQDDPLILSCEQDYAVCVIFLEKGAAVYSSELLLNGIVTQNLDFERHQLFTDHVKWNCSSFRPKRVGNQPLQAVRRR